MRISSCALPPASESNAVFRVEKVSDSGPCILSDLVKTRCLWIRGEECLEGLGIDFCQGIIACVNAPFQICQIGVGKSDQIWQILEVFRNLGNGWPFSFLYLARMDACF